MVYLKINDTLFPASFRERIQDQEWDNRRSMAITVNMSYDIASEIFIDGLQWQHVNQTDVETIITDYFEFELAGPITDNRNGTIVVKMGKKTPYEIAVDEREQALAELEEVLIASYGGVQ
jgi:hypothetical protein